ncbi:uncharacterized protein [Lolium perenne]|uniref:uncharacterized protein isoform X2 n=1 Tax=Lolium perenne TaxID=4522 RepID=UPI0021F56A9F|nr:uncharacterized protein LOC127321056 isoform X2 [Lolium perenne]
MGLVEVRSCFSGVGTCSPFLSLPAGTVSHRIFSVPDSTTPSCLHSDLDFDYCWILQRRGEHPPTSSVSGLSSAPGFSLSAHKFPFAVVFIGVCTRPGYLLGTGCPFAGIAALGCRGCFGSNALRLLLWLLADVTCCWTCLCCLPRISSFSGPDNSDVGTKGSIWWSWEPRRQVWCAPQWYEAAIPRVTVPWMVEMNCLYTCNGVGLLGLYEGTEDLRCRTFPLPVVQLTEKNAG